MPRPRTTGEKIADTVTAFNVLRDEVTPQPMRDLINGMTSIPTEGADAAAYASLVQSSIHLARIVSANDRAAMMAAAIITQSGVSRPTLDVIDGGES